MGVVILDRFQDTTHTLAKVIAFATQDKQPTTRFLIHALRDHGIKQAAKPGLVPTSRVIFKGKRDLGRKVELASTVCSGVTSCSYHSNYEPCRLF